ncbi:MAG: hypothetical protein KIT54_04710 [Phycisphaeraceae bacterium]|nr:hypothetical protein [Phycisphaeraceae bacterium]
MNVVKHPFVELIPEYASRLQLARLINISPADPNLTKAELEDELRLYLAGDIHELDYLVAESLRESACKLCLSGRGRGLDHFCATVLLTHLLCFDGAGCGHSEMPLIVALSAIRDITIFRPSSLIFLHEMADRYSASMLGERTAYMYLSLWSLAAVSGKKIGHKYRAGIDLSEAHVNNADLYAPSLVILIADQLRRNQVEPNREIELLIRQLSNAGLPPEV